MMWRVPCHDVDGAMCVISLRPNPIVNVNTNVLKLVSCFDIIFVCTFHGIVRACTAQ
jgi:hypothetical protein